MTELSRSLLSAAREGLAPDAAIAARVRAKVAASVGAAPAATQAAPSAAPAAGSSATLLKLGAALLAVGVVATGIVVSAPARSPEAPYVAVTQEHDEVREDVKLAAHGETVPAPSRIAAPRVVMNAPDPPVAPVLTSRVEPEPTSLSREVELIDLAMVSLRKNAPLAAIEAIRVFDRETLGKGQMAEDAAAIEIEARCKLDQDVTDALARFDRKWPSSAQRERIQTACFSVR